MLKEIEEWKSIRKFDASEVTNEQLTHIMQAGRRAPSWKNIQPWRFIAVTDAKDKEILAKVFAMGKLIMKAPAVIICIGVLDRWAKVNQRSALKTLMAAGGVDMPDEEIDKRFLDTVFAKTLSDNPDSIVARTFENMGIAYGFMLMEARHEGLGACVVGEMDNELVSIDPKAYEAVKSHFGLSATEIITAAIIVGNPARDMPVSPRKPESEIFSIR